jgi:hypothetical protein
MALSDAAGVGPLTATGSDRRVALARLVLADLRCALPPAAS